MEAKTSLIGSKPSLFFALVLVGTLALSLMFVPSVALAQEDSEFTATLLGVPGVTDLGLHTIKVQTKDEGGALSIFPSTVLTDAEIKFQMRVKIVSSAVETEVNTFPTLLAPLDVLPQDRLATEGVTGKANLKAEGTIGDGETKVKASWEISEAVGTRNPLLVVGPFTPFGDAERTFLPTYFIGTGTDNLRIGDSDPVDSEILIIPVGELPGAGVGISNILIVGLDIVPFSGTVAKYNDEFREVSITGSLGLGSSLLDGSLDPFIPAGLDGGDVGGIFTQFTEISTSDLTKGKSQDKGEFTLTIGAVSDVELEALEGTTIDGEFEGTTEGLPQSLVLPVGVDSTGSFEGEDGVEIEGDYELNWTSPWTFVSTLTGSFEAEDEEEEDDD